MLLTSKLKNKDGKVRKAAAGVLNKIGWEPAQDKVGALYWIGRDKLERCIIIGTPAVEPLLDALQDPDTREDAIRTLGKIGDVRAVEPLIAALKDCEVDVRLEAVEALDKFRDARAVEPLIAALQDKDEQVRLKAVEALAKIGDTRAISPLTFTIKDKISKIRQVTAMALKSLGWKPDNGEAGAWYWIIEQNLEEAVALGSAAVNPLIITLNNGNDKAAKALGLIGDPRAVESLIAALPSKSAIESLLQIGDTGTVKLLIPVLKHNNHKVRMASATVLLKLYQSGNMDEQRQRMILEQKQTITKKHIDVKTHSDDGRSSDCSHSDYQHQDSGIGSSFPV